MSENPAENVIISVRPSEALARKGTTASVVNSAENEFDLMPPSETSA
jgi:hypothetical protein